jgi:uncharacterized protein (DUF486 family)
MIKLLPLLLLVISNVFMTYAWYGHLRDAKNSPLWLVILLSWGVAFLEYCFMIPANRLGYSQGYSVAQLKTAQEIITLAVFVGFATLYLGERLSWNHYVGFALIALAGFFIFGFAAESAPKPAAPSEKVFKGD